MDAKQYRAINTKSGGVLKIKDKRFKIFIATNKYTNKSYIGYTEQPDPRRRFDQIIASAKDGKMPNTKMEEDVKWLIERKGDYILYTAYDVQMLEVFPEGTTRPEVERRKDELILEFNTFFAGLNESVGNLNLYNLNELVDYLVLMYKNGDPIDALAYITCTTVDTIKYLLGTRGINTDLTKPPFDIKI